MLNEGTVAERQSNFQHRKRKIMLLDHKILLE